MVIFEYNHKEKTIFDSSEQTSQQDKCYKENTTKIQKYV